MFAGWQAPGMESKWQINVLHFLSALWLGDTLPVSTGIAALSPALQCPSSLGQMAVRVTSGHSSTSLCSLERS